MSSYTPTTDAALADGMHMSRLASRMDTAMNRLISAANSDRPELAVDAADGVGVELVTAVHWNVRLLKLQVLQRSPYGFCVRPPQRYLALEALLESGAIDRPGREPESLFAVCPDYEGAAMEARSRYYRFVVQKLDDLGRRIAATSVHDTVKEKTFSLLAAEVETYKKCERNRVLWHAGNEIVKQTLLQRGISSNDYCGC